MHTAFCTAPLQDIAGNSHRKGLVDRYLAQALVGMINNDTNSDPDIHKVQIVQLEMCSNKENSRYTNST